MMKPLNLFLLTFILATGFSFAQTFPPTPLVDQLREAEPGDVVTLGFSAGGTIPALNAAPNQFDVDGAKLLYSDDPETVDSYGILYRDSVIEGTHRVYAYHANGGSEDARLAIIGVHNDINTTRVLTRRIALTTPTLNFSEAGRVVSELIQTQGNFGAFIDAPAGEPVLLVPELEDLIIGPGELVSASVDVVARTSMTLTVVMTDTTTSTLNQFATLEKSPDDGLDREGTFDGLTKFNGIGLDYLTSGGIGRIRIADGQLTGDDPPLEGIDAEDMSARTLRGNYGVRYNIAVIVTPQPNESVALLVNPRGGDYGGYLETRLAVSGGGGADDPVGVFVPLESGQVPTTTDAGVVRIMEEDDRFTLIIGFTPAGASSLPIDLLLVPFQTTGVSPGLATQ
jgi:hypothetical protein